MFCPLFLFYFFANFMLSPSSPLCSHGSVHKHFSISPHLGYKWGLHNGSKPPSSAGITVLMLSPVVHWCVYTVRGADWVLLSNPHVSCICLIMECVLSSVHLQSRIHKDTLQILHKVDEQILYIITMYCQRAFLSLEFQHISSGLSLNVSLLPPCRYKRTPRVNFDPKYFGVFTQS